MNELDHTDNEKRGWKEDRRRPATNPVNIIRPSSRVSVLRDIMPSHSDLPTRLLPVVCLINELPRVLRELNIGS